VIDHGCPSISRKHKGSDQGFLNKHIYPLFGAAGNDSITQHYVLGHGDTFLSDYHNQIPDIVINARDGLQESNTVCGHIGAAGYYEGAMFKFLREYWTEFDDLLEIEKQYPSIFYWVAYK